MNVCLDYDLFDKWKLTGIVDHFDQLEIMGDKLDI